MFLSTLCLQFAQILKNFQIALVTKMFTGLDITTSYFSGLSYVTVEGIHLSIGCTVIGLLATDDVPVRVTSHIKRP
jgi:hypothetical protein